MANASDRRLETGIPLFYNRLTAPGVNSVLLLTWTKALCLATPIPLLAPRGLGLRSLCRATATDDPA